MDRIKEYNVNGTAGNKNVRRYPLPVFDTVFPRKFNPLNDRPEVNVCMEWGFNISLMTREAYKSVSASRLFVGYFYPFIEDINRYEILIKVISAMICLDDHMDVHHQQLSHSDKKDQALSELRRQCQEYREIVDRLEKGGTVSMDKWWVYNVGLYIANEEIYKNLNHAQKSRFAKLTRHTIDGLVTEIDFHLSGKYFDNFEQYCKYREPSVGFPLCFHYIEFGHKMFVPKLEWEDTRFQRLLELSVRHIFYVNDFYSFEKEMNANNNHLRGVYNAVAVISILDGIDIGKAMEKLAKMTRHLERDILLLEDQIKSDGMFSKVTHDFIEKLNYSLGGNYQAHVLAYDRYL